MMAKRGWELIGTIESDDEVEDCDAADADRSGTSSTQQLVDGLQTRKKPKTANDFVDNTLVKDFVFDEMSIASHGPADGWHFDNSGLITKATHVDIDEIVRRRYPDSQRVKIGKGGSHQMVEQAGESVGDTSPEAVSAEDDSTAEFGNQQALEEIPSQQIVFHSGDEGVTPETSVETAQAEAAKRADFFEEHVEDAKILDRFQEMNLSRPIVRALAAMNFERATPIQARAIPIALMGKDIVGGAVTGSGKTAAFIVPIIERLLYRPKKVPTTRVVILCPTRELAMQCHAVARKIALYTDIRCALVVGGLSLKVQEVELRTRPDIVVATPGRFIDHFRNSQGFTVEAVEIMVMDEADRMLEEGFADELNEIITACPKSRQTMLFSATMTDKVDDLIRLSLNRPVRLLVDSKQCTAELLTQEFIRIRPHREHTRSAILLYLCQTVFHRRTIVFFRSKDLAHRTRILFAVVGLKAAELHGNMSQEQRIAALDLFRDEQVDFLLATDLASRGLDIKGIDVVINYEAPQTHEIYLHRVGRTARAGRPGRSVTLAGEVDRKVVKAAIKSSQSLQSAIRTRNVDISAIDALVQNIIELETDVQIILDDEKQERQLKQAETEIARGENKIRHEKEIMSRPRRTWFQGKLDKAKAKDLGADRLNGASRAASKSSPVSNKDKKHLDLQRERKQLRGGQKKHSSQRQR
ncbi:nucleolar DEAD-box protein required for synthesis of 60S ribosomal subunit [Savitreella phatthalungensis]